MENQEAMNYLLKRGITKNTIEALSLGYTGPYNVYDTLSHRIAFPIHSVYNEYISVQGRALFEEAKAKYWHREYTEEHPNHRWKGKHLYGLNYCVEEVIRQQNICLVEGPMDVASLLQVEIPAAGLLGLNFTEAQAFLLRRFTNHVTLWVDSDMAGQAAVKKLTGLLREFRFTYNLIQGNLKDPNETLMEKGAEGILKILNG